MLVQANFILKYFSQKSQFNFPIYAGCSETEKPPPRPEPVICHKSLEKCNHIIIYNKYHYDKLKWNTYQDWENDRKEKEKDQLVAGNCPHCGSEIKKMRNKSDVDSIQYHKINYCTEYPYGNKKKT